MPRFSANIAMMFREHAFIDRVAAARDAGFAAVEMPFPYEAPLEEWEAARRETGMEIVEFNIPAGDVLEGGYGYAAVPGREERFREAVEVGREWALRLGCTKLNVLAGYQAPWLPRAAALEALAASLRYAAGRLADDGITVLLEAVNRRERPGYLIATTEEALEAMAMAGNIGLALEHDLYHLQIMEGDILTRLAAVGDFIGHIQFADVPGRHEPGTGEMNYPRIFEAIDASGYTGWCGAEYFPSTERTEDSLGWFEPYRDRQFGG